MAYLKFCAALYSVVGVGIGLLLFVLDAVGMSPVTVTWEEYSVAEEATVERTESIPLISGEFLYPLLVVLAAGIAVAIAVSVARNRDLADDDAMLATGLGTGVGSTLMLVLGGFLGFQKLRFVELFESLSEGTTTDLGQYYSIEPLNLLVNALVVGVLLGAVGAVVVAVVRKFDPGQ